MRRVDFGGRQLDFQVTRQRNQKHRVAPTSVRAKQVQRGNVVTWAVTVPAGGTVTLTYAVTVDRDAPEGATLTNVARGGIVDDAALARALREKRIAGAALDVFEGEPKVHPDLLTVPNVVLTPHIASATVGTRRKMAELAADNLVSYLVHGKALTPVNPEVLKG